jgi:hypothetical protein
LIHIDFLEEEITHFDEEIETFLATQTPIESPAPASFESAGTEHESTPDAPLPSAIPTILPWAEAVELLVNILNYSKVGYTRLPRGFEPSSTDSEDQL